jgi:catechol 2,3-dioxygenase-like lactoylglutathione lyase family enzyme
MPIHFDHAMIPAEDKNASARFLTGLLGLPDAEAGGPFLVVTLDDGVTLLYAEPGIPFPGQHFAFLVTDDVFDAAYARIRERGVTHWADPRMRHPGEINTNHGGRGVYFDDPSGHHFELLTRRP